jgi:hypothetical protein
MSFSALSGDDPFVALRSPRPILQPGGRAAFNLDQQAGCSIRRPPGSRIDLNRRRHAGYQANPIWYLINPDVHRHTLSKTYPSEDRVHRGKPLLVWLRV